MLAEIELNDAVFSHLDIDGVLAFAKHAMTNAARLWMELGLDQKQHLQQVLFPEGLRFDWEKCGTAALLGFHAVATVRCTAGRSGVPDLRELEPTRRMAAGGGRSAARGLRRLASATLQR